MIRPPLNFYQLFKPVFLIGCGRSGTTILGQTLGKHKSITYLNERRDLWHKAYPEFDIWTNSTNYPKVIATKSDNDPKRTDLLRKQFHHEQVLNHGTVLLEKLPINNFRLEFISSAFPDAKYIYLHRNGMEVAKSIEKMALEGRWYRNNGFKWKFLEDLIRAEPGIPKKVFSTFEKGLLEWRFSIDFSESFFSTLESEKYYSLSYKSFIENPQNQIKNILIFLNLGFSENQIAEMIQNVSRKSEEIRNLTEMDMLIGGSKLQLSVQDNLRQKCDLV